MGLIDIDDNKKNSTMSYQTSRKDNMQPKINDSQRNQKPVKVSPAKHERISKAELKELHNKVKEIPISNIILSRLSHQPDGSCCCPFHDDKTTGSFHYDDQKNWFKCFSCETSGDGVNFIEKLEGKKFSEAVLELSAEYGIMSKDDYKRYTGIDFDKTIKDYNPIVLLDKIDKERSEPEITDFVFKEIISFAPLSSEHKQYLLGRGLTEKQIVDGGYFTLPQDKTAIEKAINTPVFKKELENTCRSIDWKKPYDISKLRIPGLYTDTKGNFHLSNQFGLGIPIRDVTGKTQAIQIRKDKVEPGEVRYLWWTSGRLERGATPGCPVDVQIPRRDGKIVLKDHSLLISEGHFKAQVLAGARRAVSISVQGVQNIKELDTQLRALFDNPSLRFDKVKIFYDMDICKNKNIFTALCNLYDDLNGPELYKSIAMDKDVGPDGKIEHFPLPFVKYNKVRDIEIELWNPKVGKGADDYIEAGGKDFKVMMCSDFIKKYQNEFMKSPEFAKMENLRKQYSELYKNLQDNNISTQSDPNLSVLKNNLDIAEYECEDLFVRTFL